MKQYICDRCKNPMTDIYEISLRKITSPGEKLIHYEPPFELCKSCKDFVQSKLTTTKLSDWE